MCGNIQHTYTMEKIRRPRVAATEQCKFVYLLHLLPKVSMLLLLLPLLLLLNPFYLLLSQLCHLFRHCYVLVTTVSSCRHSCCHHLLHTLSSEFMLRIRHVHISKCIEMCVANTLLFMCICLSASLSTSSCTCCIARFVAANEYAIVVIFVCFVVVAFVIFVATVTNCLCLIVLTINVSNSATIVTLKSLLLPQTHNRLYM